MNADQDSLHTPYHSCVTEENSRTRIYHLSAIEVLLEEHAFSNVVAAMTLEQPFCYQFMIIFPTHLTKHPSTTAGVRQIHFVPPFEQCLTLSLSSIIVPTIPLCCTIHNYGKLPEQTCTQFSFEGEPAPRF